MARKSGEYVVIGEDVVVRVVSDCNGELQLEIDAPGGMDIIPGEESRDMPHRRFGAALNSRNDRVIDKIAVWKATSIVLIDPSTILYFTTDKKRVIVHTEDGVFESNSSLECLEDRLSNREFFRCHKSFLVNMDHVNRIVPWFHSTYIMELKTGAGQIPVSRYYTRRLKSLLNL